MKRKNIAILSLLFAVTLAGPVTPVFAQGDGFWGIRSDPRFVDSHMGVGGIGFFPVYFEEPYLGFEAYATFRPSAAKYFYSGLEQKNVGISLSLTYLKLTADRGFVDAGLVFRKYLANMKQRPAEDAAFVGIGFGILGVYWEDEGVEFRDVSVTAEIGYEYRSIESLIITVKAQTRYLEAGPINFSGVGVALTLGWRAE
jgi:hypothetical protein